MAYSSSYVTDEQRRVAEIAAIQTVHQLEPKALDRSVLLLFPEPFVWRDASSRHLARTPTSNFRSNAMSHGDLGRENLSQTVSVEPYPASVSFGI